jgi:hypothetical protein
MSLNEIITELQTDVKTVNFLVNYINSDEMLLQCKNNIEKRFKEK